MSDAFVTAVAQRFAAAPVGTLLSSSVQRSLQESIRQLLLAGAERVTGDTVPDRAWLPLRRIPCCEFAANSS